jgi:hypothetical protein
MSTDEETITSHAYDVDLIATYHGLLEMEFTKSNGLTKELYLKKINDLGESFCKKNCLYYPFYFNQRTPLVVPSSFYNFELYLGLFLISFEIPKIPALLTYQKSNYKVNFDFEIEFSKDVNIPIFAEKFIVTILYKIFKRVKQFIEMLYV